MRELGELAGVSAEFRKLGARIYAIAHQDRETLRELQTDLGPGVTLLADPEGKVIVAFGMLDPSPFPPRPMARAGIFLINRDGVIERRWLSDRYHERPDPQEILRALR